MNQTANVQTFATGKEAREHLKGQLAEYLAQAPASTQSAHKWMKRVDVAGLGVIVAAFIVALYISIAWKSVNPLMIPVAWFFFAASPSLVMVFVGLHAILLRAFPPVVLPGKFQKFVTGSGAVWAGMAFILGGLVMATFWTLFAYAVGTFNMAMLVPLINILGVVMSIVIVIQLIYTTYKKISKSR